MRAGSAVGRVNSNGSSLCYGSLRGSLHTPFLRLSERTSAPQGTNYQVRLVGRRP
jgi:hypothetical protein